MRALQRFHWLLLALFLATSAANALEVRQTRWGFDGSVVPDHFNPVTVLLSNDSNLRFAGEVSLHQVAGGYGHSSTALVQSIEIEPHRERWVQFAVFNSSGNETFELAWSRSPKDSTRLEAPPPGPPVRITIGDDTNAQPPNLKAFPAALFPTSVSLMDGLDGVALDAVPSWQPEQRAAFLDWILRGGLVAIVPDGEGHLPQFADQLAVLNFSGDTARIGAGTVFHGPASPAEAQNLFVTQGFPAPELKPGDSVVIGSLESSLFQRLATLNRPRVAWWLINSLAALYLALIGPAHYFLGRRLDYRWSIGVFLACAGLFSALFGIVGRRGYGETPVIYSLSIARALEPGRFDVTQWSSAFATSGADYTFTHRAPANFYATIGDGEIKGAVRNGSPGQLTIDIPVFSSRQFVHRATMHGDDTSVAVEKWEDDGEALQRLVLNTSETFPQHPDEITARFHNRFYRLQPTGGRRLELAPADPGDSFDHLFRIEVVERAARALLAQPLSDELRERAATIHAQLRYTGPLLCLYAMGGRHYFAHQVDRGPAPTDRLQLFVLSGSPEGFHAQARGFDAETGCVLYVQDVLKP